MTRLTGSEVLDEIWWLLEGGVTVDEIATQMGRTVAAIEMLSRRYGRAEINRPFNIRMGERNRARRAA